MPKRKLRVRVAAVFSITCVGATASELVGLGNYDWANVLITDERFPVRPHGPVTRKIELVEFLCHDPSSDEALAEFSRLGLERPTTEDALQFGVEHPDEQRKGLIVFLHEPVRGPLGLLHVLALSQIAGWRNLSMDWFGGKWRRGYRFAGVRK